MEFVIRRLGALDILRMGASPDLRAYIGKPRADVLKAIGKHLEDLWKGVLADLGNDREFHEKIVMAGVVSPKVIREPELPGTVCVNDLAQEELSILAGGILKFSLLTKQEAEKIGPLPETENSSSISIPSGEDTDDSQAKSSQSTVKDSPPIPSTSHVPAQEPQKKKLPASA
jgi:hypothetical protein